MTKENRDNELIGLLGAIKEEQITPSNIYIEPELILPKIAKPVEEPVLLPPVSTKKSSNSSLIQATQDVPQDEKKDELGIKKLLDRFSTNIDLIISNHAADRQQAEDAYSFLNETIRTRITSGQKVGDSLVEAWIKCLAIKADINTNAVTSLDAISKLLSAAKKNDLIINLDNSNNLNAGGLDLVKLLSQPFDNDEFNTLNDE